MKSLEVISNLENQLTEAGLESIVGGKTTDYSDTTWYKWFDWGGKVAEAGSGLWRGRP